MKRLLVSGIGATALIIVCSAVGGCASSAPNSSTASNGYSGYSAGMGMSPNNVQTNSTLPGPRYYQSTDEPFHQN